MRTRQPHFWNSYRSLVFTCLCLLLTALLLAPSSNAESIVWSRLTDGLSVSLWTPPSSCHDVPPLIAVNIDPVRYRFAVHYFRESGLEEPPDIHQWRAKTGHDLVFNAGLFRENFAYLGLLYGNGRSLGGKRHGTWLGLFAAEPPEPGMAPARILDLAHDSFDDQNPSYREVAQSLMLLDETGRIRVKRTGKQAQQTIVAEQADGHILLFKTTEPTALFEIGQCLHDSFQTVRRAMAMDGGASSDVVLAPPLLSGTIHDAANQAWASFLRDRSSPHIGLPAVIGISPRRAK